MCNKRCKEKNLTLLRDFKEDLSIGRNMSCSGLEKELEDCKTPPNETVNPVPIKILFLK